MQVNWQLRWPTHPGFWWIYDPADEHIYITLIGTVQVQQFQQRPPPPDFYADAEVPEKPCSGLPTLDARD